MVEASGDPVPTREHGVGRAQILGEPELDPTTSTATIGDAPAIRAPWIAESPTPPQPITSTESPGRTFAVFSTAPTPS